MAGGVSITNLMLGPPNLKIQVKRAYQTAKGQQEHIVGYQGAGTTKDNAIEVKTLWLDRDGSPLPDCTGSDQCDMQMTGRLAVVNEFNSLTTVSGAGSSGNQISLFPIRPGAYTQLITLNGDALQPNHFYVQVSGESLTSDGFFNTTGSGADFGQRPKLYTPVRVPVFDEARYNQLRDAAAAIGQSPNDIPPAYRWPYRPDMGFSIADLTNQTLTIHYKQKDGKTVTPDVVVDLTVDDPNQAKLTSLFDNSVEYAKLTYNLDTCQYSSIDPNCNADISAFGSAPQQYIFALGGDEHQATLNSDGTVTFNHTDSLQKVTGSDLESLSLYMNSDPSNVLWQVEMPGLYVYYQAPTPLQMVEPDHTLSTKDEKVFRSLGGMRLMLNYLPQESEQVEKYEWSFQAVSGDAGRFKKSFKLCEDDTTSPDCALPPQQGAQVYWEPDQWKLHDPTNGDTYEGTLTLTLKNQPEPKTIHFEVRRRVLAPADSNPMEGQDVRMLEGVLWHLGISPQAGFPGMSGARINSSRDGSTTNWTKLCGSEAKADRRDVYTGHWNTSCQKGDVSLEGMVRRFQARNVVTVNDRTLNSGQVNIAGVDGVVDDTTLGNIDRIWMQYLKAYEKYKDQPYIGIDAPAMQSWLMNGPVAIWQNGYSTIVPATYTDTLHQQMLESMGLSPGWKTRADLIRAWKFQETKSQRSDRVRSFLLHEQ